MSVVRRYGWLHPRRLGRTHLGVSVARGTLDALPIAVELAHTPDVYDQGAVGSCTAQALACAVETVARRCGYQPERPSRRDLYYRERRMEGTALTDAGAILADGVTSLTRGWLPESRWPHSTVWGPEWTTAPPALPVDAPRVVNAEPLAITVDDVIWEIASGHPVVVGLEVTDAWETLTGDRLPDPEGSSIGGHAVCLVGYDRGLGCVRVRNSWGESWGDRGEAWLPLSWLSLGVCGEAHSIRAIRRAERV